MKEYINFKKVNCKDCYKCLRNCPVKSMRFTNHQADVIEDECILCGNCYLTCPQYAKEIRNDTNRVKALFKSNQAVYVSLAPSFIANYRNIGFDNLKKALLKLGFSGVYETAVGAQVVTNEYEKIIQEKKQNVVISTCCPTVNLLIRKYYPEAIKYMAPVVTPMIASAQIIKKEHPNCSVVFIGPCLAKKEEVDENLSIVDAALTFQELTAWFNEEGIILEEKTTVDFKEGFVTRLYPTTSGILRTMKKDDNYSYFSIDGINNCKLVIEEILNGEIDNCFIEMSSCYGSCVNGPGMDNKTTNIIKSNYSVQNYAGDKMYATSNLDINASKSFDSLEIKREKIPEEIVKMLLAKIGKTKPSDELNCGSCGYNTCREKVYAMYYGKTEPSMCLPYLKNKAMSYMDDIIDNNPSGIIVLNDKLEIELINKAACEVVSVATPSDVINQPVMRILDPTAYLNAFLAKTNEYNKISYLSEYDKYIEENIIYDQNFEVVMIIIRDITTDITTKDKKEKMTRDTIEVTDKIIEKQMRAVQEIASLLGETTAETKVALEKLKESLNDK